MVALTDDDDNEDVHSIRSSSKLSTKIEEEDEDLDIDKEFTDLENEIKGTKSEGTKSELNTKLLDEILKKKQKKIEEQKEKKQQKLNKLKEIKSMSTTLINNKEELKNLEEEYVKKLTETQSTKEASKSKVVAAELKIEELKLKQLCISNIFWKLKQSERVDICFMVDCTGSMRSYIKETKKTVHNMVDRLAKMFPDFKVRVAFVAYRDHSDGVNRIDVHSFSDNIDEFKTFVTKQSASGGGDAPEDIFGGKLFVSMHIRRNQNIKSRNLRLRRID